MKFARVPQGTSTCGWCYFLASKGACYHGEAAAVAGSHEGCDCEVVAVKDDSELPWNVKWMRSCWADCSDTVGGPLAPKETRALWDALDESERARWRERHGSKAYEKFHERKSVEHICAEVERRDAGWLYRGVEPPVDYSANPRSAYGTLRNTSATFNPADYDEESFIGGKGKEWRDLFAHDALKYHGFTVTARPASAPEGFSNIDLLIGGELWEVKSPQGVFDPNKLTFVDDAMKKARYQFDHQYDKESGGYLSYCGRRKVVLNLYYKKGASLNAIEQKLRERMSHRRIHEVVVIEADGSLTRIVQ